MGHSIGPEGWTQGEVNAFDVRLSDAAPAGHRLRLTTADANAAYGRATPRTVGGGEQVGWEAASRVGDL